MMALRSVCSSGIVYKLRLECHVFLLLRSPDLNNTPNHVYWVYQDGRLVENHVLYNSYGFALRPPIVLMLHASWFRKVTSTSAVGLSVFPTEISRATRLLVASLSGHPQRRCVSCGHGWRRLRQRLEYHEILRYSPYTVVASNACLVNSGGIVNDYTDFVINSYGNFESKLIIIILTKK